MSSHGWVGVDLDGTLAHYDEWRGPEHIGAPIKPMVARVQAWLAEGVTVKIFTARVGGTPEASAAALAPIRQWSKDVFGQVLEVTATKDYGMIVLYDDRCVRIVTNTGEPCCAQEK